MPAASANSELQKLFLGSLVFTGELKADGKPKRRCVTSLEALPDGREAGDLMTDEAVENATPMVNWRDAEQADERLWATETEYMAGLLGEDGDAFLEEDETGSRTGSSTSPPHVDTELDAEAELLAQLEAELAEGLEIEAKLAAECTADDEAVI